MGLLPEHKAIYEAVKRWRQLSLVGDRSVFTDASLWTESALEDVQAHFVDMPGKQSFMSKLEEQLMSVSASGKRLAAEILWVMMLFPSNVTSETKRTYVRTIWSWSGKDLPEDCELLGDTILKGGIGNPGQGYAAHRWRELKFFLRLVLEWRRLDPGVHGELLGEPWRFAEWLDTVEDATHRQLRHILLHLLFPNSFERISVSTQKRDILAAFAGFLPTDGPWSNAESGQVALDQKIFAIRERLREELEVERLDFYEPPLSRGWDWTSGQRESLSSLEALLERGQIVYYGPPGTGKTHDAKKLAEKAIESAAFREMKGDALRIGDEAWETIFRRHVVRCQLHPAYSYEDFIVGLFINETGGTEYRDGLLLRLIDRMKETRSNGDEYAPLPFVLILDEINRADLARLLGEAFSAFEHRGEEITISAPWEDAEGNRERLLCIPHDLLVIGTMNLIDQSLEQVDFAVRRRFAWFERTFSPDALQEVAASRWRALAAERGLREDTWHQILPDVERLQIAATKLNDEIADFAFLGPQYVVGHTYFSETLPMVADRIEGRTRQMRNFFWDSSGPRPPLQALWDHHLQPLLEQYLAGLEGSQREERLESWKKTLFERPSALDE